MASRRRVVLGILAWILLAPVVGAVAASTGAAAPMDHMGMSGGQMGAISAPGPFYQERTFLILLGVLGAAGAVVAYRVAGVRFSRRSTARSEAILVVDLVESTHLATHYGDLLAMRATTVLKERALSAAEKRGVTFVENTGDGWFMTFPSVTGALAAAASLLRGLEAEPPDLGAAPPMKARAAISFGEILTDARGGRHGVAINKAFRLVALAREGMTYVEGEETPATDLPDRDRILLDEDATQELQTVAETPRRFVGFCRLRGFPGLHRVYEARWRSAPATPSIGRAR